MNEDRLEGSWTMLKGKVREQWGRLTNDEIDESDGRWEYLAGLIQKKYGRSKEVVEREIERFKTQHEDAMR